MSITMQPTPLLIDLTLDDESEVTVISTEIEADSHREQSDTLHLKFDDKLEWEWNTRTKGTSSTTVNADTHSSEEIPNSVHMLKQEDEEIIGIESESDNEDNNKQIANDNMNLPIHTTRDRDNTEELIEESAEDHLSRSKRESSLPPLLVMDALEPIPDNSGMQEMPTICLASSPLSCEAMIQNLLMGGARGENKQPKKRMQQRKQRRLNNFTDEQISILAHEFEKCEKLGALTTLELMSHTGLEKTQIQAWFGKMRKLQKTNKGITTNKVKVETTSVACGQAATEIPKSASSSRCEPPSRRRENSSSDITELRAGVETSSQQVNDRLPSKRMSSTTQECRLDNNAITPKRRRNSDSNLSDEQIVALIESRKARIPSFSPKEILEALTNREPRSSELIRLFMDEKCEFKKKLLNETIRIKERAMRHVFTDTQKSCIAKWRAEFMQKQKAGVGHCQETLERLDSAESNVLAIWIPLLVYGRLLKVSLVDTVRDFTFNSRHRPAHSHSPGTETYIIPKYLQFSCRC